MKYYILIWVLSWGQGLATGSTKFESLAACEAAKAALREEVMRGALAHYRAVCAPGLK